MFKKYALMFLVSMVPLIELRGSIPIGLGMGLNPLWLYIICIVGNMLPVPFIFFFARKVLVWGSDKKFIGKFLYWALFLFVGIPLPGTGAWTGTLAASLLDMDFKKSVIAVMAGVILAGIIMGLGTAGVLGAAGAIFG